MQSGANRRYLYYALGEFVLIVAGIVVALQINNWNEWRKDRVVEKKYYENLLTSLRQDSAELVRILEYQTKSVETKLQLIESTFLETKHSWNEDQLNQAITDIANGTYSFFPKYGTYTSILTNTSLDIFQSEEIKSRLIDLYDYKFKRYEDLDVKMDQKYHNDFYPFMQRQLGLFDYAGIRTNYEVLETQYEELSLQCQNLFPYSRGSKQLLEEIQISITELISLIQDELKQN